MIFRIKHRWWFAVLVTAAGALAAWPLGGWGQLGASPLSPGLEITLGIAGGCLALAINAVLHESLTILLGERYLEAFRRHGRAVLGPMHWPEYICGGLMAACAEEPLFRGVVLGLFQPTALGIAVAALLFALCHWLRREFLPFWIWALWEGVLFGILLVATGSLLVPMIAHGLHDVVAYRVFQALAGRQP